MFLKAANHRINNHGIGLSLPLSNKQSGLSLLILLFIIIVLALLTTALIRFNNQSFVSNAHQVVATRAFFAAESAANLQAMQIFPINGASVCSSRNFSFVSNGLSGCVAQTQCSLFNVNGKNFYQVTSQGQCNTGQILQSTRTIQVRLQTMD